MFLASQNLFPSRAKAQQAIEEGLVEVNDEVLRKPAQRLQEGDSVRFRGPTAEVHDLVIKPIDLNLDILYEDDRCFVLNKPSGTSVHPGAGTQPKEPTILHGIAYLFSKRAIPFDGDSVLAHRLDKGTTGCLLIAKEAEAHALLQKQFEERTIEKQYLALVVGAPSPAAAVIDAPVGRSTTHRTKMAILGAATPREAQTTYRTLAMSPRKDASLLLCTLHTGRTHQVRVHLSSIGHPILGDDTYTSPQSEMVTQDLAIQNLCLHAWKLTFISPADTVRHTITAPLPLAFRTVLQRMGMEFSP
jgi:23S rRNA pseudouridine1911/1915/1917 synthase